MKISGVITAFAVLLACIGIGCKQEQPTPHVHPTTPTDTTQQQPSASPALDSMVMYEVNLRAFSSAGNFQGVMARLDSLQALGVNTLWLMPIFPVGQLKSVGQLGSPYSVRNYTQVNTEFGDMATFQQLVKEAHKRNMAVILDWVANHTAWDNPWISNRDWYTQDAAGNIVIPPGTNWQDVADLNFNNAAMRLAMIDAMKFWVNTADIDGFRYDAADMVPFDFWKQALDSLKRIPNKHLILLAEGNRPDHFAAGFQMNYAWDFYNALKNVWNNGNSANLLVATHTSEYANMSGSGQKLRFTTNHDETAWDNPPVTIFKGTSGALAASAICMYMGGVPLLYTGQEVGEPNKTPFFSRSPINWTQNPAMLAAYKSMIRIRQQHASLRKGTLKTFSNQQAVVFQRTHQTDTALVMINVRGTAQNIALPSELTNSTWKNPFDGSSAQLGSTLSLQPFEYRVWVKKH